jgi:hypothetical protein
MMITIDCDERMNPFLSFCQSKMVFFVDWTYGVECKYVIRELFEPNLAFIIDLHTVSSTEITRDVYTSDFQMVAFSGILCSTAT